MPVERTLYAVVRQSEGIDHILADEISSLPEEAIETARKRDERLSDWAQHNPQQRLVTVSVTEKWTIEKL